ncbi:MAG: TauD/TfdA family dioxygenase [Gammaproteobacteria bacterium]|nr:TauD/TfdA family dioxygenase [Gammaproteobacteria bacterium]
MSPVIQPITSGFAGEVAGVDCRAPLSPDTVAALEAGMDQYAVLVYRGQDLSDAEQLAFTVHFGEIEKKGRGSGAGRIHFRTDAEARALGVGIGDFSNMDNAGNPLPPDARSYQFKLADRLWHSDSSFRPIPAKYSLLSGRAVPSWGGNTEFADMRAAYDALDERTKREVEDLVCHHSQIYSRQALGFDEMNDEEREAFKPVRQRLVRRHPVTGRKSLFLSAHAGVIEGWTVPESRMYLRDLIEFATQPRFVYSHRWQLHDFVVWDNRSTMHRGRRFDPNEARDVRQTRLAGDAPTIEQLS